MRLSLCLFNLLPIALGLKTNSIKPGQLNSNATKRAVPESRIVGGYEVDPPFMYPFLASLQRFRKPFCGGALYDENTVITAAHCTNGDAEIGFDAVLHRHDLSLDDAVDHGIRRRVIKRIRHAEYDEEVVKNDIAIWKLEPNENYYGNFVSTLSLDDGSVPKNGYVLGRVAGWGYTISGGVESKKLLEVKLPFYDMKKCGKAYEEVGGYLDPKKQICAGYPEGGKDACQGDSGGPLFAKKGKKFILVGVVSWGIGCATPGIPGIYTRIEAYQDWIAENMK